VGTIPFRHLRAYLDGVLTVTEEGIARAMVRGAREARLVIEPSGATTLAALLFDERTAGAQGHIVAIISGGNVDADRYAQLLAAGVAAGG
jgi:threonine dehydratase